MKFGLLLLTILTLSGCTKPAPNDLHTHISSKLENSDYPKGGAGDYQADKKPHLIDLMARAKLNRDEKLVPLMISISGNKEIFWEVRENAILYLAHYSSRKDVREILKKYSNDKSEPLEIREAAQGGL